MHSRDTSSQVQAKQGPLDMHAVAYCRVKVMTRKIQSSAPLGSRSIFFVLVLVVAP